MTTAREQALHLLQQSDTLATPAEIDTAVQKIADAITTDYGDAFPLVLSVMGSAVVFTGLLLTRLPFPLDYGTLQLTAINSGGGTDWRVAPTAPVKGRTVLVLDDLLDDGRTMAAIHQRLIELGATKIATAVLCDKMPTPDKPVQADYFGFAVPDRHVFGCGLEIQGFWRNLKGLRLIR